jgi:hypothetical protein
VKTNKKKTEKKNKEEFFMIRLVYNKLFDLSLPAGVQGGREIICSKRGAEAPRRGFFNPWYDKV